MNPFILRQANLMISHATPLLHENFFVGCLCVRGGLWEMTKIKNIIEINSPN